MSRASHPPASFAKTGALGLGGTAVTVINYWLDKSGFSSSLPGWFIDVVGLIGLLMLLWAAWLGIRWYRASRSGARENLKLEPSHVIWGGMILALVALLIIGTGIMWQARYLAAKIPLPVATDPQAPPTSVQIPKLSTQHDREKFRRALDELSQWANRADDLLLRANSLLSTSPRIRFNQTAPELMAALDGAIAEYHQLDDRLFLTGIGPLFRQYSEYQTELLSLLPPQFQDSWNRVISDLSDARKSVGVVIAAQRHPDDQPLIEGAIQAMEPTAQASITSGGASRERIARFKERINAAIKAI